MRPEPIKVDIPKHMATGGTDKLKMKKAINSVLQNRKFYYIQFDWKKPWNNFQEIFIALTLSIMRLFAKEDVRLIFQPHLALQEHKNSKRELQWLSMQIRPASENGNDFLSIMIGVYWCFTHRVWKAYIIVVPAIFLQQYTME